MPFRSEKQRRYLWANEPAVAEEFEEKTRRQRPVSKRSKKRKRKKGVRKEAA